MGINSQSLTGWDIYRAAATATGMLAAHAYRTYTAVFNQERVPDADPQARATYGPAEKIVPDFLKKTPAEPGRCWNVNLPAAGKLHRGYKETNTAAYHPGFLPPLELLPRAREEKSDVTFLRDGYATITSLALRVNPQIRY